MTDITDADADWLHAIPAGIEAPLAGRPDRPVLTIARRAAGPQPGGASGTRDPPAASTAPIGSAQERPAGHFTPGWRGALLTG